MKKFAKVTALVLALAIVCMALVACGGKTSTIDNIKKNGKLTVITEPGFAPFEYMNGDKIDGVDVEISQKIAEKLGVELEMVSMDFDALIPAIQAKKADMIAAGMTATDERAESVNFSVNYIDTGLYIIVVKGDSTIGSADDIAEGVTVGVQTGTTSDLFVSDTGCEVGRYKTVADAVVALQSGKVNAVVCDQLPASDAVANNDDIEMLEEPLTVEQYAIASAKGDDDFTALINEVLEEMLANGEIDELVAKHMELAAQVGA